MKMRMNCYQPKRRRYYFWRRPTPSATHGNFAVVRLLCSLLLLSSMPQLCDGLTTLLVVQNPSRGVGSNIRILPVADGRGRPTSRHAPSNPPPFPTRLSFVLRSTARPNDDEKTEPSSRTQFYDGNILSQQEFERRSQLDATIQALRLQLPLTLTRPLTAVSAQSIFESNVQLTVLVADDSVTRGSSGGKIMERETQDELSEEDEVEEKDEIKLLESREELIALSDVLVLGTSTAQQASAVLGGFGFTLNTNTNSTTTTTPSVECQIILDPSCKSLLIPWKAQVPNLFPGTTRSASSTSSPSSASSSSSSSTSSSAGTSNTFVGLSEFQIRAETGKITRHRVKQVFWNGQSINGPNIGQALRALQSTMANIPMMSNNPLFRGLLADVRDGFLEQAAAAVSSSTQSRTSRTTSSTSSSSSSNRQQPQRAAVIPVTSIQNITGFIVEQEQQDQTSFPPRLLSSSATEIPLPGTEEWNEYAAAHETMVRFLDEVIPALSRTSTIASMTKETTVVPRYYFATNATLRSRRSISKNTLDGLGGSNININNNKALLQGQDSLANFFQGLSLARRSTGGSWKMQRAVVLDWKKRKIAVNYIATNSPWTITGQDVYTLADSATRPLIQDILQTELSVTTPDGGVSLDGPWLMKNLASAVERSSSSSSPSSGTTTAVAAAAMGPNVLRDLFMDVFLQQQQSQPSAVPMSSAAGTKKKKRKVSQTAAANTFYFMSDLKHSIPEMWNTTTTASSSSRNPLPPAAEYFDETVELRGYLGETLLRGSTVYNRAIGSLLATTRQSLAQKRLVLDVSSTPPPRVELTAQDKVRVTMVWAFRVPPPGVGAVAGALFPEGVAAPPSVPLTLEIVSDYSVDPDTGKVIQHKLVETRVNGQLTPGDVLSRSLQRFWKLESSSSSSSEPLSSRRISGNEDLLQSVSEAVSWLRSFSSNSGGKQ